MKPVWIFGVAALAGVMAAAAEPAYATLDAGPAGMPGWGHGKNAPGIMRLAKVNHEDREVFRNPKGHKPQPKAHRPLPT